MKLFRSLSLAALAASLSTAALAADAAAGKQKYVTHGCFQCHGFVGQGGAGPKLAPNPMPYDTLASFVRTTNRAMPPYSEKILPNEDLADIYAYLESIPKGPDPKSIQLLNP
jgi:mono/diheme cytochrome c family protein